VDDFFESAPFPDFTGNRRELPADISARKRLGAKAICR
jgi:hypothetical protein